MSEPIGRLYDHLTDAEGLARTSGTANRLWYTMLYHLVAAVCEALRDVAEAIREDPRRS